MLKSGAPDPRAIAPLLAEYGDVFRLAGPAATALRPALAVVGAVNRLRGSHRTGGD